MRRFSRWGWLLSIAACAGGERRSPPAAAVVEPARLEVTLPEAPSGPLAPSLARVRGDAAGLGARISDVESCAICHADVADHWRKSAHAFASFNNPVYRVAVDKVRRDRGEKTSHFCGGCHDISLLVDGAMQKPIEGTDLRAHAGVTCGTCHGIAETRPDGNASWDLDAAPIPVPAPGDAESLLRHRARVGQATLRTSALCSTCHKAFLDRDTGNAAHLTGQDDATPWARSAFAGSHAARIDDVGLEKDCRGCHMPRVPAVLGDSGAKNGTVASHAFLGGHTWLASMQSDPELVARAQAFMKDRVSLDVGGVRHAGRIDRLESAPVVLDPGEDAVLDVVVRNLDVGHRFPGGVMDAQDTWIEVVIENAHGKRVAEAGTGQEASGSDPSAHTLSSYMAHADGTRALGRETHEFRAGVWNHTIPPRDAAVVGYGFTASSELGAYPLRVDVKLRHRSRALFLQKAACADTRSERGRTFGRVGLQQVARAIDACRPQPVTDLAHVSVTLSGGGERVVARADETHALAFERRHAYGLGLSHALQEHLDDARGPLAAALSLAASPREEALALGALALVASRQGRTEETFALAARADAASRQAGFPSPHPAMQRARADVLASTWHLAEAAPLYLDVARRTPRDDSAWAAAGVALGSIGDSRAALGTARLGLAVQPRDGDLLRVQSLALPQAPEAEQAFLERRTPDEAPSVRAKCSKQVPGCATERVPVHVHAMRPVGGY